LGGGGGVRQSTFYCYDLLLKLNPPPIIALQRAIALGFAESPQKGIGALLQITKLGKNYLYRAALGDFYAKAENKEQAQKSYKMDSHLKQ